ncbi:MFS transporter [Halalkalibacter nanhaiisediminis]|uniref:YNFM family putative membrane transporter n=1 Tax=Halalkalibacter nanhaiisediminis TaxID=688079 RepID=A0A562QDA3_9BACI|nr:MFS transporter [Halalkalibacter nanhaiisediminis]TWI54731.1 YNFM family putative membrane transporter [Halalkalibacter nanhaiisediminis]
MEREKSAYPYQHNQVDFWKVSTGLTLASFLIFGNLYIVQPLLPLYTKEFQLSPTISSLSLSLTTIALVIGLLLFGFLSDRIGRVAIIRWTLCLSVIPLFMIPLFDSFSWLLMWRFVTGLTLAGLPAVAVSYISEEVSEGSRGLAVSLYIASNALGGMGGRYIGGYFADQLTWQAGFFALAIVGVLICCLSFYLIPTSRFFQRHDRTLTSDLLGMATHLKNPMLLFAFIFGMMLQFGFSGIWTYVPFYLEKEPFFLSVRVISLIYFTYLFGVLGSPLVGRFAIHYCSERIMFIGVLIMMIGNLTTIVLNTLSVVVGLSLICFGFFIAHSMVSIWIGNTASHHKSGATSFYLVSYYIGASVGGTALGTIWSGFGWIGVIIVCSILPLVSAIIFLLVSNKNTGSYVRDAKYKI